MKPNLVIAAAAASVGLFFGYQNTPTPPPHTTSQASSTDRASDSPQPAAPAPAKPADDTASSVNENGASGADTASQEIASPGVSPSKGDAKDAEPRKDAPVWQPATVALYRQTQQQNEPVLFYFSGPACAPCRVMERTIWSRDERDVKAVVGIIAKDESGGTSQLARLFRVTSTPQVCLVSGRRLKRWRGEFQGYANVVTQMEAWDEQDRKEATRIFMEKSNEQKRNYDPDRVTGS